VWVWKWNCNRYELAYKAMSCKEVAKTASKKYIKSKLGIIKYNM